jgi:hypothetical protein
VRTDSQEDQGFEVGEAGGTRRFRRAGSRGTWKHTFGRVEREPIVAGGTRQLRLKAWESAKLVVKDPGRRVSARRWITAGEQVAPRGARDSCEGKTLKGGIPGTAAACNKAAKLGWARKPLRG